MPEAKTYRIGELECGFVPSKGTHCGPLTVRFAEMDPFEAELDLQKSLSRARYVSEAAATWGLEDGDEPIKQLRAAINAVCVRRSAEVAAAEAAEAESVEEETQPDVSEEEIGALVARHGVLNRYVEDASRIHGVVGEREPLKLLTLNALGAQLEPLPNGKPLGANVVLTAEWGRGKNHLCDAVATLLPGDFYLAFESASAKSLYYRAEEDPRVLAHRWIYLNEAEAMDQLVEMLRPLLSGGKASHLTVNKVDGQNAAQELNVEGPVTITIPTIRNKLDPQLQSRLLTADLPDYEGRVARHSRATSRLLLPGYASEDFSPRIRAWQAALRSLASLRRVVFPLDRDEFCFDSDQVSHGARLWANVLGLMSAHAWLEQRNRQVMTLQNGERAIVATPADYEAAYDIFKATCKRSVKNVSPTHRKILDALYELQKADEDQPSWVTREYSWSQREIEKRTGVPQSTISGQKTFLTKSLKLVVEDYGGKLKLADDVDPSLWKTDDALDGFPRPEQVRSWWDGDDEPQDPETPGRPGHARDGSGEHAGGGANGDRPSAGHRPEASGHGERDEADHRDDRSEGDGDRQTPGQENAVDERESVSENAPTGATGGFGDRETENGGSDGEDVARPVGREAEAREEPEEDDFEFDD
jgi:hypothetical protein